MTPNPNHAPEPAEQLRRAYADGQPEAIDALAEAFLEDALRFSTTVCGDRETALDAVQETFLVLIERHGRYDPSRAFRPWMFAICRSCCLQALRVRSREAARVVPMEVADPDLELLASDEPAVRELLIEAQQQARAMHLLAGLDSEARSIVALHLLEGLTFAEVAEVSGRPAPTVATIYYRALQRLRDRAASEDATAQRRSAP